MILLSTRLGPAPGMAQKLDFEFGFSFSFLFQSSTFHPSVLALSADKLITGAETSSLDTQDPMIHDPKLKNVRHVHRPILGRTLTGPVWNR